ncbi:MAG: hypothetical protein KC636_37120, partial [Myxococcales bacterium]|nr:hypothetical protein [Myxococcales bacterium]
ARVRHQSLAALDALGTEAHALFRVQALSSRLPDSGCYQPKGTPEALPEITTPPPDAPRSPQATFDLRAVQAGTQTSGEAQLRVGSLLGLPPPTGQGARARAFRAEAAPSYFGPGHATRPRGCAYPVQLSLGTYPWVYGNALDREAPGLAWEAGRPWRPAALAMRVMASLWAEPAVNLGQDARLVAAQYRHFRAAVNELLEGVPVWTDETRGVAGRLYRRAGLLYVHQGSAAIAR